MAALAEMERGLVSERTQIGMDQLKATHKKFTQSIYGWDVDENGSFLLCTENLDWEPLT